jgi:hypothetical protein
MNVMEKCKHKPCQCTVLSQVIDNATEQEVDLNPQDTAEPVNLDATTTADSENEEYCCAHCAETASDEGEHCGCGHEDCAPTESVSTSRVLEAQLR